MPLTPRISNCASRIRRTFYVIASDGGFLSAPVAVTQLTISPAERFEVLVDFANGKAVALETGPDEEMGIFGRVAPDGSADYVPVMRFEPTAATPIVRELPTRLVEPSAASPASAVRRRQFVLNSGLCASPAEGGAHTGTLALIGINGKPYDIGRIDVETELGTTEVWEVVSVGMAHPFHVHGALFRILSIEGGRRRLISRAGRILCSSKTRPNCSSPSISRQRGSIPSCITATSLNTRTLD